MTDAGTGLDAVFEPASVAVYGASATDSDRLGNRLLRNVAASGRAVTVVHPRAQEVDGHAAVPSLDASVDLALVSVPAERAVEAVADAADGGARAAIVLASGFGESGPDGRRRQERLLAAARATGMRIVGPNCMGVVSRLGPDTWLDGSYFAEVPRTAGGVSMVSQSGAFGGMFLREVTARGAGLARFLSIGNAADVGLADALAWLATDERTTAIGCFVESIADGAAFIAAASTASARVPVVAIKAGRHAAGARAAASHTGAIAGVHGALRAAFLRSEVSEATRSDDFFDRLFAAGAVARKGGRRVAIVTVSGGPAVLAADACAELALELPELAPATQEALRALVPDFAPVTNPVDLTPQCPPAVMGEALRLVYEDPAVEGVIVIDYGMDLPELGRAVADATAASGKRTTGFVLDAPAVTAALTAAGIPLFAGPERAAAGYAAGMDA